MRRTPEKTGAATGGRGRICPPALVAAFIAIGFAIAFAAACRAATPPPTPTTTLELGRGVKMEFVLIPAGAFVMGSEENAGEGDESPQRRVTLTRAFYLGRFEVTQAEWEAVMGANPSEFRGALRPVDSVSWDDCQRFIAKVKAKTGRVLALPTEAQWEYACRAGTGTAWSFGAEEAAAVAHAWLAANAGGATHPVGEKHPNPWGLYDLHGNVWEWCADAYEKHAYRGGDVVDPRGPAASPGRILRGGGWGEHPNQARSAVRNCNGPDGRHNGIGFRCLLQLEDPPAS